MTTLIKQKGLYDCVLASISMAAGHETWEQLWTDEDLKTVEGKGIGDEEPWLKRAGLIKGVHYRRNYIYDSSSQNQIKFMLWKRRAMISAHSLNTPDGGHMMYWDGQTLYDPSTQNVYTHLQSMILTGVILFDDKAA